MIAALPVVISAAVAVFALVSLGILQWHLYQSGAVDKTSEALGKTASSLGDIASNPLLFAAGALAVLMLLGGRR